MFKWLGNSTSKSSNSTTPTSPSDLHGDERYFGLENFGNTCYANSVLQALYYCRPFREGVLNHPHLRSLADLPIFNSTDPSLCNSVDDNPILSIPSRPTSPINTNAMNLPPVSNISSSWPNPNTGFSPTLYRRRLGSSNSNNSYLTKDPKSNNSTNLPKGVLGSNTIHVVTASEDSLIGHLKELFHTIASQKKRTGVIGPKGFVNKLKKDNIVFRSTQQQDAHEFLNFLLNALAETSLSNTTKVTSQSDKIITNNISSMEQTNNDMNGLLSSSLGSDTKCLNMATVNNNNNSNKVKCELSPNTSIKTKPKSWIHELFEGELATETRCLTCESITQTRECYLDISIDVEANSSIASCLWNFSQAELMCHQDKFYCDTCSGLQEAERSMKIKKLPPVLALHLKRFKYMEAQGKHVKLMHRVVFPTELRLLHQDVEPSNRMYDLFAIVIHIGGTPNHGHYVALVRSMDNWILFDDGTVEIIPETSIAKYFGDPEAASATPTATASGYILFYQVRGMF